MAKSKNQKKPDDLKEQAIQIFGVTGSITQTAKQLGVAKSTIHRWLNSDECSEIVEQIRTENKIEFAEKAGELINKSLELLERRVGTALKHETELELLLEEIAADGEMNAKTKEALYRKIKTLELQKLGDITTAIGTLYDKRALARGESTSNNQFEVNIKVIE